eukprot:1314278-Rhodomonas_salina.1
MHHLWSHQRRCTTTSVLPSSRSGDGELRDDRRTDLRRRRAVHSSIPASSDLAPHRIALSACQGLAILGMLGTGGSISYL